MIVWDEEKQRLNIRKHGLRFAPAIAVLDDPYSITVPDHESDPSEERWITLGTDAEGRILVVVYTHRGEDIRLISARRATRQEQKQYGRRR